MAGASIPILNHEVILKIEVSSKEGGAERKESESLITLESFISSVYCLCLDYLHMSK